MSISSVGGNATIAPQPQARPPERAERGPDHDNDGDEKGTAAATKTQSSPPPGRGGNVNVLA